MKTITDPQEMQSEALRFKREGKRIGVVPTMGYLHEGHLSLIRLARENADVVMTTLFVNPLQFAPSEDFTQYPRDPERDARRAEEAGCDILFAPEPQSMYAEDRSVSVTEERLTAAFEGEHRPGHFDGVLTVVAKLFNTTLPDLAVFGQKDAQQLAAVQRMVRDLNFPIEIVPGPIIRESDGLAMSSRNVYLSDQHRKEAVWLQRSLQLAKEDIANGLSDAREIENRIVERIREHTSGEVDYVAMVDPATFVLRDDYIDASLIVMTVRFGKTRLLDNLMV